MTKTSEKKSWIHLSVWFYVKLVIALLIAVSFFAFAAYLPGFQTRIWLRSLAAILLFILFFPLAIRNWILNLISYFRYLFIFLVLTYGAFVGVLMHEGEPFANAMAKPLTLLKFIFEATMPLPIFIIGLVCLLMLLLAVRKRK